ncbi:His(2)-Cys(2) zinc finger [Necator americanus]|uniref:His(2)-Cys(2) zinc finger n=1 Tax=Necator americanus TaxID=51031 RepID=W2SN44_NECAM|nr:His(2)-Cys(2) zinc finger [Necator americanus]ETN70132.1 His(2)-Cys(2) zinc finger [Necator americanus]
MAACTYLHSDTSAQLLMAKSKLPSLQCHYTIPKLELNGLTLAIGLTNSVFSQLKSVLNIKGVYVFSDSEIVLSWLKIKSEKEVGQFVSNRLIEIRNITNHMTEQGCFVRFGYVSPQDNPADCATRGLNKDELVLHFWWTGPNFIHFPSRKWLNQRKIFEIHEDDKTSWNENEDPMKVFIVGDAGREKEKEEFELLKPAQIRTFGKARRIMAYVVRIVVTIVAKLITKRDRSLTLSLMIKCDQPLASEPLNGKEIQRAETLLIKHHQETKITPEIIKALQHLNILKDDEGILRCYLRLGRAQMNDMTKYPILIFQKTDLAKMIICDYHRKGHPGINHTIALVRQKFWIPQLRSQVITLIRKCLQCQKFNNLPYKYPQQEDLPKERVIRSYPIQHFGVDYFGPLPIISPVGQGKCYGSIITCMTTRLIHLDVVSDLTTVAFLHMLRRFFARRGIPQSITITHLPSNWGKQY